MNKTEHRPLEGHQRLQQEDFLGMLVNQSEGQPESLISYGEPKVIAIQDRKGIFHPKYSEEEKENPIFNVTSVYRELRGRNQSEIDCSDKAATVQEMKTILNSVFPPLTWREEGKIMRRSVSFHPASRSEMVRLQSRLDELLTQKRMKTTGLCPERQQIFDQCMDELSRQEIVNCPPRGLLLLRIRDELRSSIESYQSLYLSNAAHAARKALRVETEKKNMGAELELLREERQSLINNIHNVREQLHLQEEKFKQTMMQSKRSFNEERENIRRHNQNLKSQLETMVQGNRDN